MKNVKLIIIGFSCICTLLITHLTFAQTKPIAPTAAAMTDPKAKVILDAMSKKYKAFKTVKASFKIIIESAINKVKEEKKGVLVLKGQKYQITLDNQEITCDNKTVWTYMKESNEVQVNNYEADAHSVNPADIFTMYEKGFIYQLAEVVKENGKDLQVIELTPTDKKKDYFKIKLFIDKAGQSIFRTKIFSKNGNMITYEVTQFTANPDITDAYFSFDAKKHPGVEVNDIR